MIRMRERRLIAWRARLWVTGTILRRDSLTLVDFSMSEAGREHKHLGKTIIVCLERRSQ